MPAPINNIMNFLQDSNYWYHYIPVLIALTISYTAYYIYLYSLNIIKPIWRIFFLATYIPYQLILQHPLFFKQFILADQMFRYYLF